jgi:hypothetical protein
MLVPSVVEITAMSSAKLTCSSSLHAAAHSVFTVRIVLNIRSAANRNLNTELHTSYFLTHDIQITPLQFRGCGGGSGGVEYLSVDVDFTHGDGDARESYAYSA